MERVWKLQDIVVDGDKYSEDLEAEIHRTIKKVGHDYDNLKFNTTIASLMSLSNQFNDKGEITKKDFETFLTLLNPVAPHITEEIWENIGLEGRIFEGTWPKYLEEKTVESVIEMPIQINGKVRGTISLPVDADVELAKSIAFEDENIKTHVDGKTIVKEIFIPGKIFNIVVK